MISKPSPLPPLAGSNRNLLQTGKVAVVHAKRHGLRRRIAIAQDEHADLGLQRAEKPQHRLARRAPGPFDLLAGIDENSPHRGLE